MGFTVGEKCFIWGLFGIILKFVTNFEKQWAHFPNFFFFPETCSREQIAILYTVSKTCSFGNEKRFYDGEISSVSLYSRTCHALKWLHDTPLSFPTSAPAKSLSHPPGHKWHPWAYSLDPFSVILISLSRTVFWSQWFNIWIKSSIKWV